MALLSAKVHPFAGLMWMFAGLGTYGYAWWFIARYALFLIQAGHIAVLTELITTGSIANGATGMFDYGRKVVADRFGEVNALFALNVLIRSVVLVFNRTLNVASHFLPIPGLRTVVGIANAIVRAATRYVAQTVFSYNLRAGRRERMAQLEGRVDRHARAEQRGNPEDGDLRGDPRSSPDRAELGGDAGARF